MKKILIILLIVIQYIVALEDIYFQGKLTNIFPDNNGIYSFDIDNDGIIDTFSIEVLFDDNNEPLFFDLKMKINNEKTIINIDTVPADFIIGSMLKEGYMSLYKDNPFVYYSFNYKYDKKYTNWFLISKDEIYKENFGEHYDENGEYISYEKSIRLKIGEDIQESLDGKIAKVEGKTTLLSLEYYFRDFYQKDKKIIPKLMKSVSLKIDDLSNNNLTQYNNIAYYLQQANANEEAIFLLEKIIEKYPNRTVAYLNLADAYLGINDIEKAKQNYDKYVKLMKQDNKEEKIPKRVLEFLKN